MLDSELIFSSAQTVGSTAVSTNVLDFLAPRDIGVGNMLELNIEVNTLFVTAGAATLQAVFQGSVDNTNFYDIVLSPVVAVAALTAGSRILQQPVPRCFQPNMRAIGMPQYFRLNYVVGTSTFSAGKLDAWLTADMDREAYYTYPRAYTA